MKKTVMERIQWGLGGLLVLIAALLQGSFVLSGLYMWMGILWLVLAWKTGLSTVLVGVLVFVSSRVPLAAELSPEWLLAVNLGLSTWTLALLHPRAYTAPIAVLLWLSLFLLQPALILLVLAGIPRLSYMYGDDRKWVINTAVPVLLILGGLVLVQGDLRDLLDRLAEEETYLALFQAFESLLRMESFWILIPVVGLFEITNRQPDDVRMTWRNLVAFAAVVSFVLVPAETAVHVMYTVGLPLSAILLTRWFYALPDPVARVVYAVGLIWMCAPLFQPGVL